MDQIPVYQIATVNDAATSENRIHSDEVAKKFGFTGALVSGVSVFGYLTHPLVEVYGENWLSSGMAEVKFIKPAYVDDLLTIKTDTVAVSAKQRHHLTMAYNQAGELLARLESWLPLLPPSIDPHSKAEAAEMNIARKEISFEGIKLNVPSLAYDFVVGQDLQQDCLQIMRDDLAVYYESPTPPVHPYYLLKECNQALMRMFILPAWIHVGSRLTFRSPVKVGQRVNVHTIPTDKWESKGHQFIKLYIAMNVDGNVVLEVEHTAIFRISAN